MGKQPASLRPSGLTPDKLATMSGDSAWTCSYVIYCVQSLMFHFTAKPQASPLSQLSLRPEMRSLTRYLMLSAATSAQWVECQTQFCLRPRFVHSLSLPACSGSLPFAALPVTCLPGNTSSFLRLSCWASFTRVLLASWPCCRTLQPLLQTL